MNLFKSAVFRVSALILAALISVFSTQPVKASSDAGAHGEEKEFKVTETILHHIADAHEFHIAGDLAVYLPVILLTDNGLDVFSSSHLYHNPIHLDSLEGHAYAYNSGKNSYVMFDEHIYYAGEDEEVLNMESGEVQNAAPIDISITKNVFTLLMSFVLLIIIFFSVAKFYKKNDGAPKGLASFMEPLILFVRDDIARANIGKKGDKYVPFLLTIFFFIWFNNLIGLIPFFPFSANLSGNIAFTFTMAFITLLVVNFSGNKHYWKHIFMPPVPWPLWPIMIPVELVGVFTKPFALMIRLFANITAGHIVVLSLISLIFIFGSIGMSAVSVPFTLFISVLELLVAALQAYIFTMLTALFIGQATEDHTEVTV